jgi:polyphosphate kinase 2 (PPK2 family)
MKAINDFERLLIKHNNTQVLKFYLHVSEEEQTERLTERISNPKKMWKYNAADLIEAKNRDKYYEYYEEVFDKCNDAPWDIIPADQNWYKSYLVAVKLRDTLKDLKMQYPGLKPTKS